MNQCVEVTVGPTPALVLLYAWAKRINRLRLAPACLLIPVKPIRANGEKGNNYSSSFCLLLCCLQLLPFRGCSLLNKDFLLVASSNISF